MDENKESELLSCMCRVCGYQFTLSDDEILHCPACNEETAVKQV